MIGIKKNWEGRLFLVQALSFIFKQLVKAKYAVLFPIMPYTSFVCSQLLMKRSTKANGYIIIVLAFLQSNFLASFTLDVSNMAVVIRLLVNLS